jgi:hypothetical protein
VEQSIHWAITRSAFLLETSHPSVFAAGDVRPGSVKRVASAVGEGAMSVQFVHEYGSKAGVSIFHWGTGSRMAGIELEEDFRSRCGT